MDRDSVEVFLLDPDECYERLRRARFGATVSCVYCGESDPVSRRERREKVPNSTDARSVRRIKGRGSFESDKPPVVTLVRRSDGRVEFLVRENLQNVDEEIAKKGDETVILCTDAYTIYNDIDDYDGIDAHLAITHDDTYVIGDAHVNSCENRHSFLRQWLAKFRGVSKHHLQGYLNFLGLLLNDDADWFSKILSYESSG